MIKYSLLILALVFISCKQNETTSADNQTSKEESKSISVTDEVAIAYGIENWKKVEEVNFSFVVNPGENESLRKWTWKPKSKEVTLHKPDQKITYNRDAVQDEYLSTDKAFINDSFWLTSPFHMVWDDIDYELVDHFETPLGLSADKKIKINYPKEGGYTPGDRYDIYLNKNHHIVAWSYHPKGQEDPFLINTFEDLTDFNGIKVNLSHSNPQTGFQLNFRDVSFK